MRVSESLKSPGRSTELCSEKAEQTDEVLGRERLKESSGKSVSSYDLVKSYQLMSLKPEAMDSPAELI